MKKDKKASGAKQSRTPHFGRVTSLVGALVAAGVLSTLSLPEAVAASHLPLPCGGCVNNAGTAVIFQVQQPGMSQQDLVTLSNIDPITGLPNPHKLTIKQPTQTAILNWQEFNIDKGYSVNFVQPNSEASTLNRVWDPLANPSRIAGSLTANGQLYLINQNGIIFANGAQVNTNQLIASSLDISDTLYQAGYLTDVLGGVNPAFSGNSGFIKVETGAVLNGSRVMMFAPVVENKGTINTPDGQTVLAAGTRVYLEASQDPSLRGVLVEVDLNKLDAQGRIVLKDANGIQISKDANGVLFDVNGNRITKDPTTGMLTDALGNPFTDAKGIQLSANDFSKFVIAGQAVTNASGYVQNNAAGTVTNAGDIIAQRGNITVVGFAVNQEGRVSATTSVTENGSIKLLARYSVANDLSTLNYSLTDQYSPNKVYDIRATQTGKVTLAKDSVTQVVPELNDTSTIASDQTFNPSIVEVMGNTINMQGDSKIISPGGRVTLAAISSYDPVLGTGLSPNVSGFSAYQEYYKGNANSSFLNLKYKPAPGAKDLARVFLDSGSLIDVSGSSAKVSVARNILTVQLRGSQLADSALQRTDHFLWGENVLIDIRQGTSLAKYSAEEGQIGRGVAELTSTGGTVNLISTGDVVTKSGSKVDLSGGQIKYEGANIKTTTLVSEGVVYDIGNASPDNLYRGISGTYTEKSKKWGVSETYTTLAGGDIRGRWDPGYTEGKNAGTLTVLAPQAVINGDIVANTVVGTYQREAYVAPPKDPATDKDLPVPYKDTWTKLAKGGTLIIGDSSAKPDTSNNSLTNYITNDNVTIQSGATKLDSNLSLFTALPVSQQGIVLDAGLFGSTKGLNRLEVYSNRTVTVASGTTVKLAPGGSITLQGDQVNMLGSIDVPSGTVNLGTIATFKSTNQLVGNVIVGAEGSGSYISTRGQWVNDSLQLGVPDWSKPLLINGGSIKLSSGGSLQIAEGTRLDASGGAQLDSSNKIHGGSGGAITLVENLPDISAKPLLKGVDLRSFGTAGGTGGALTIQTSSIALGEATDANGTFTLSPAFFQNGGFSSYDLTALGDLTVLKGTVIEPKAQSLILDNTASKQVSGSDVSTFTTVGYLPDWQRNTSISLTAKNDLKVEDGAVIRVEPTANIKLSASNQLTVLGTLDAAAGSINLSLNDSSAYISTQSIWLGSASQLLSQGYFLQDQPNSQNLVQGQVLAGGKINIKANSGYVVVQKGSLMDVSGATADLDLPQLVSGSLVNRRSHIAGDAGSIAIQTSEGGFLDGTMKAGVEAGSQAAAGQFSLTLNNDHQLTKPETNNPNGFPAVPAQIQVMADGNGSFATKAGLTPGSDAGAGQTSLTSTAGKFWLDAKALQKSGFDQVTLKSDSSILLDQANLQTRRSLTLDAPVMVVNGISKLESAHVTLGQIYDPNSNNNNQALLDPLDPAGLKHLSPSIGSGLLNVTGQLVDLTGNFVVSGVRQNGQIYDGQLYTDSSVKIVSSGDIRLNGALDTSAVSATKSLTGSLTTQGNVTLQANQVYPTTMAQFTLSVKDDAGTGKITIQSVQPGQLNASPVMSAGGALTLSAAEIEQNGVVKAPLGTLTLDGKLSVTLGEHSLTSVSADGLTIPYGQIQGGNTWIYDLLGTGVVANQVSISKPPEKLVKLTSPKVVVNNGATLDMSGSGDLYAYEFFAGSGGSVNVLDPVNAAAKTYAIIPGISGYSPYDPQASGSYSVDGSKTSPLQSGTSVYLAGGDGIKAGYYTLLPASYALLPGAYRVTAVSGNSDRQPGQGVTTLNDGSQIMAGKFAVVDTNSVTGASIQDARYSSFMVTPGLVVRTQSEFHDSYANKFFTDMAATNATLVPRLAIDGGQLIISAKSSLAFDGTINAAPATGGRGALVDLDGTGFDIVNTASTAPVYSADGKVQLVQLTTSSLNKLEANSLLIGGTRKLTTTGTGMEIAVTASEVVVDNKGSVLSGPEIILAAKDKVTVKAGSDIEGSGKYSGQASNINIGKVQVTDSSGKVTQQAVSGDGALLRVSSASQVGVTRTNLAGTTATLSIEDGATVGAEKDGATVGAESAALLDSSYATTVGNKAVINAQSFSVAAQNIDIGNPSATNSLALSGYLLARVLTFKDITLHSYNDINFYETGSLGKLDGNKHVLDNLVLDSRNLNGISNENQTNTIDAANVTLLNSNTGTATAPTKVAYGEGNLKINADQITLGAGDKAVQGFDKVTFAAAKQIVAQGKSNLTITSGEAVPTVHELVLQTGQTGQTGQITGTNKSDLTITASNDNILINSVAGDTATAGESLNAKLKIVGNSIKDNGVINLSSGTVTLHATGANAKDGVTLKAGSIITATGISKIVSGQTAYAQAGTVSLQADNGGVTIESGAVLDVSGAAAGGDAGSINIAAANGAVTVAGELRGKAKADPKYAQGSFTLDANSLALNTGSLSVNALTDLNDTLTYGGTASSGGFTALRDMRVRTGDLVIAADAAGKVRAKAQTFHLTADTGMIDVYGKVDASGVKGGDILLAAGAKDNLTLNTVALTLRTGALLDAHASGAGERGGKVTLETTETRTAAGVQKAAGTIELGNQFIDVHGDGNTGGSVLLRAPQIAVAGSATNNEVAINNTGGASLHVSAGANVTVDAFKTYSYTGSTALTVANAKDTTGVYLQDATDFANNAYAIKNRLGMLGDTKTTQHLAPGVELDVAGDLSIQRAWDLSTWRFNDGNGGNTESGMLTVRAAGNLNFVRSEVKTVTTAPQTAVAGTTTVVDPMYGIVTVITIDSKIDPKTKTKAETIVTTITPSLTDGVQFLNADGTYVTTNDTFTISANGKGNPVVSPLTGQSWSYRLVSGADLASSDVMAVNNKQTGDFTLGLGKEVTVGVGAQAKTTYTMEQIRTGTGFIDIAAGRNLNLSSKYSVIYTFGQPATGVPVDGANINNKYFGVDGGDVTILAKGDINGAATDQLVTDWQWRQGLPNADGSIATQPAWWINLQSFRQNVGALGGGNVSITAGKNINTLSAVAPTTGYVDMVDPTHPAVVLGGGNLSVSAGGDINSGVFYVGKGQGTVRAGGSLGTNRKDTSNTNSSLYTVLALGQGNFDVRTGGDLNLQTVLNPTAISQGTSQFPGVNTTPRSYFFTYDEKSGVSLSSLAGDVNLYSSAIFYQASRAAGTTAADGTYKETGSSFFRVANSGASTGVGALGIYPGTLVARALNGSIVSKIDNITLFPSASGDLQLIAAKDIQFGAAAIGSGLVMTDAAASAYQPGWVTTINSNVGLPSINSQVMSIKGGHSSIHAEDTQPVIVSAGGNISGYMVLPKSAQIEAGQDVQNLGLIVQNLLGTDTTSVIAGRDISYVYDTGASVTPGITVYGPGQFVLQAGRNVDLGRSNGVVTKGNLQNNLLPVQGADVTVLAGVGQGATETQAFIDKYVNPAAAGANHDDELIAFAGKYGGSKDQTAAQAFTTFASLSKPLQDAFVRQVFFSELKQSGRSAVNTGNYQEGYDAIATLFPTSSGYKGNINLYSSQIKTERGGNINLLTPGGGVNAGLAIASSKPPSEIGIVTIKGGDVNAFVNNDFMVNQSRVFTLQGGNILMWSSYGNIDAGKGSKSVSSTPAPLLMVDLVTGTFNVDATSSVVGSGIRVLLANKNVVPGDVDLIAPVGTVNAGDAGIGSAGNITIAALHVVGADNINFGGTSAGVPVAAPAPVSVGLGNLAGSDAANQVTQSIASAGDMNTNDFKPTFLSIEVIGLGDGGGL